MSLQVLVFAPLLEHAPDQIASRPFEMLSVTEVPAANVPDPLEPTATLIPAGLDKTRSPLRPLAETVSVAEVGGGAGAACGVMVKVAERVTPPPETEIVTEVCALTSRVKMLNPPFVVNDGTVIVAGTKAIAGSLLDT